MCARAVALWCALALAAGAAAYTVDCNHEYTDCDTELSKLAGDEDDIPPTTYVAPSTTEKETVTLETTTSVPVTQTSAATTTVNMTEVDTTTEQVTREEVTTEEVTREEVTTDEVTTNEVTTEALKPQPRLLNLGVDELQNFALALHNQSEVNDKKITDLSDVTLDGEEDYEPKMAMPKQNKDVPDKFYSNLQAPFQPIMMIDKFDEGKEEGEFCKENEVMYKVGERIERGCEESCECTASGVFDCSPRCKHPYIRRGRRLSDPLCFESPVDDCCSIIACATGNGDMKLNNMEVCRYGNDTHTVGSKWNVGCEQQCSCEKNSVVTCKPRCNPLPQSDKCINVQDPNDTCCEMQVCDVSQDVHEEVENVTSSTSTTTEHPLNLTTQDLKSTMRPLVLAEPIGSVKVLQNNSVQVNLMHVNSSDDPIHLLLSNDNGQTFKDVKLKYDNLILNLDGGKDYILKTKETGTKFNFTITAINEGHNEMPEELIQVTGKIGCHQDGKFYEVGEEFHIGCTELCECTGAESRECAALECPSHVGLELVSKGCVRWAPSPPPQPPNCCPRTARCLSDGTCHYKEVAIPNWTEVPISLTGCEQRCFCENGELDCQEVCTPLSPLPPQTMRCPPLHRPAPVNISDDDCCKQWGCVPNTGNTSHSNTMQTLGEVNFVTPVAPIASDIRVLPLDHRTASMNFYRHLSPVKSLPKILKTFTPSITRYVTEIPEHHQQIPDNRKQQSSSAENTRYSIKNAAPVNNNFKYSLKNNENLQHIHPFLTTNKAYTFPSKPETSKNYVKLMDSYKMSDSSMHDLFQKSVIPLNDPVKPVIFQKHVHEPVSKNAPVVTLDKQNYFMPSYIKNIPDNSLNSAQPKDSSIENTPSYFKPVAHIHSVNQPEHITIPLPDKKEAPPILDTKHITHGKHVTVLRTKDLKQKQPTDTRNLHSNMHVLTKSPNPYETVLLRAVPNAKPEGDASYEQHLKSTPLSSKPYSTLDLETLLSQMEVESEVNRNLGRSTDKKQESSAGSTPPDFASPPPHQSQQPSFLPTIPPEIHFPQDEETPDYEQNNIHRPVNPLVPGIPGLPPVPPNYGEENKKLSVITLVSDSPTSVKMLFGLPPVLVGLRGSVDLRYTDKPDDEITHWYSQVFAPADEILTTSRLEFRLTGLKPSTMYKVRGKLYLHNLPVEPESEVYSIRTQDLPTVPPVEEKRREINSRLTVLDVNDTVAHVTWRRFTEEELQYIDGIQIRYRPVGTPIYSMTELLHHSRAAASLHELHAGSRYEASLVLVPPPRATTELVDPTVLEFTTAPYVDPYNWTVTVEARSIGAEAAELTWKGIPSPAERWVRVYRAAHACGGARREHDAFRLAARDLPPSITLSGLEPDTRCRVWLELFLTNGKVKTSNVLEINTKSLDSPEPIDNAIEASSVGGRGTPPRGDYYGALVAVGVVAALGALTSLLLLLVVVRRHRPRSVPITPVPTAPRESSLPPYDNPAYKLELQQETMDL